MSEPPFLLDGTRVVAHAAVADPGGAPAGFVSGGVSLEAGQVARLAIAENLASDGVFLLCCTDDWAALSAERFATEDEAREAAARAGLATRWEPMRALSEAEEEEVRIARRFLRELADEFPDG